MAANAPECMGFRVLQGNNMHTNLESESRQETKKLFETLTEGGKITMNLQDMCWGAYYGTCTDRFGINRMLHYLAE